MERIVIDVDEEIKKDFVEACFMDGRKTQKEVLHKLIEDYSQRVKQKKGK